MYNMFQYVNTCRLIIVSPLMIAFAEKTTYKCYHVLVRVKTYSFTKQKYFAPVEMLYNILEVRL